jgi:hypothetical protein
MRKRILVASLCLALGGQFPNMALAQVIADSGFRPKPHGFSFENWGGGEHPHSKLTPDDVAFLFGDQACARRQGDTCIPTPGAKLWMEQMNKATEGGHCEGMAVLSAAFHVRQESVDDFGARQAFELKPDDEWLMRTISLYFTTQALEPVQSVTNATRRWSLQQIVDQLVKSLKAGEDYPTLGIYGDAGGHAVTPYKVEQTAPGVYRIHIYDNNYPGVEKHIDVDTGRNRWVYEGAALNPSESAAAWSGGAGSMDVTLLSTRYEPLKCPFCGPPPAKPKPKPAPSTPAGPKPGSPGAKAPGAQAQGGEAPGTKTPGPKPKPKPKPKPQTAAAPKPKPAPTPQKPRPPAAPAQGYTVYTSSRCSQVEAVGKTGKQQIKMGAQGADSQISGASMYPMRGTRGCVVQLPADQPYDVRLRDDGKPSSQPTTGMTVFGPGRVYQVADVKIQPGKAETVSFSPTSFSYQAGGQQRPTVRVAEQGYAADSYYEVKDFQINEGHSFAAEQKDSGRFAFSDDDPELDDYDIDVEVVGDEDTEYYAFEDVSPGDEGEVLMEIDEDGEFDMDVDTDGDGETNYYDEDDDNDGSSDEVDTDDDNDGVDDESDADFVGEDYDDEGDEGDGEDDAAGDEDESGMGEDESTDDDALEDDADAEGEDEGLSDEDDGSDEGDDADIGDEGDYEDESGEDEGGLKTAANGEDDGSGESADDEGSAEEESAEDEGYSEDESAEDEGYAEDEAAEDESADDEGYAEDESAEDEGYAEDESADDESTDAEDESAGEDEWSDEDEQSRTSGSAA